MKENIDLEKINRFLIEYGIAVSNGTIRSTYRGDQLDRMFKRLGIHFDKEKPDIKQFSDRLFMVGEKAKTFYSNELFNEKLSSRTFNIDSLSNNLWTFIFDKLNDACKNKNTRSQNFFGENISFAKYFGNKSKNKMSFISKMDSLQHQDQILAKKYYLTLLHQLGSQNFLPGSLHISTSSTYAVAKRFASSNSEVGIVLHSWIPISPENAKLEELEIPIYTGVPYVEQNEQTIFAGILPHYILGFEIINQPEFYFNPNILLTEIPAELLFDGLLIDQETFGDTIVKTMYKNSFENNSESFKLKL